MNKLLLFLLLLIAGTANSQTARGLTNVKDSAFFARRIDSLKNGLTGSGSILATTAAGLRSIVTPQSNTLYQTTDLGGGQWYYDAADNSSADNTGTVIVTAGNKRLKRLFDATKTVSALWFGVKADGSTNDRQALQNAIDYCMNAKALHLSFPQGQINFDSTISFGTNAGINGAQTSFVFEGQGMNNAGSGAAGGTVFRYTGTDTSMILFNIRKSFGRYGTFKGFTLRAPTTGGANTAINFETSAFSFFRFEEVEMRDCKNGAKLNAGDGGNGEFTEWHRCKFTFFSNSGYYQDAPQAVSPKFLNCSFAPLAGAVVWKLTAHGGGQFIGNDISFLNGSAATPNCVFQVGGPQRDPLGVMGGRWENVQQLVDFNSSTNSIKITFRDLTASWVTATDTNYYAIDFNKVNSPALAQVIAENCTFYRSTSDTSRQPWRIRGNLPNVNSNFAFVARDGEYNLLNPVYEGATNATNAVCKLYNTTVGTTRVSIDLMHSSLILNNNGTMQTTEGETLTTTEGEPIIFN